MAMTMRSLNDVPPAERDEYLADMGEMLEDGTLTEEEAAYIVFGPDPIYGWMASQDSQMVPARPQLI